MRARSLITSKAEFSSVLFSSRLSPSHQNRLACNATPVKKPHIVKKNLQPLNVL